MKKTLVLVMLSLSCILALEGCRKKSSDTGLTTTAAAETMSSTAAKAETSSEPVTTKSAEKEAREDKNNSASQPANVSASLHTYKEGNAAIEYPIVSNLTNSDTEKRVNDLLKANALSVIKACSADTAKDSLTVECRIVSADRKRITAVYTGLYTPEAASYPVNLFYTNTVDTALAEDIELIDYADPYTLAGYVLSGDCQFYKASPDLSKELMAYRTDTTLEEYTELFRQADFPLKTPAQDESHPFPQSFSYEDQGTIIVSIPVPHALGDYALISYTPETK